MALPAYPPKGHSAPLLFDSLEPRLLLNADVLAVDLVTANPAGESQHLLVRMIEESTRTATQAETVQRVQIVDRQAAGDTGVLAVRDLDKITGIAIFTGDGDDSLIIDHTSFDGADMPPVFFDGGAGNDRLDLVSPAPGVWDMNSPDSGAMTLACSTITFAGVEELHGGATPILASAEFSLFSLPTVIGGTDSARVVTFSMADDVAILRNHVDPGYMEIEIDTLGTYVFANPTDSLTIFLQASSDSLTIESLDPGFAAALSVNGAGGNDTIRVTGSLSTGGHDLSLAGGTVIFGNDAHTITVSTGDPNDPTRAAGDLTVTAARIEVREGVTIDTTTSGSGDDGAVTLEASMAAGLTGAAGIDMLQMVQRYLNLPGGGGLMSSSVDMTGATVRGGTVTITAETLDKAPDFDAPLFIKEFVGELTGLLDQLSGPAMSQIAGVDLSVIVRITEATVTLDDTKIDSSGSVTIGSTTSLDASGSAIAVTQGQFGGNFQIAAGFARGDGTAKTELKGNTEVTAAGSVRISSNADVNAEMSASASNVQDAFQNDGNDFEGDGVSAALAIANAETVSHTLLGSDVTIISTGGNVNIGAFGASGTSVDAAVKGYIRGKAGITAALGFDFADILTRVEGTIHAAGTGAAEKLDDFNPATVLNTTTNRLTFLHDHGFTTGEAVEYRACLCFSDSCLQICCDVIPCC